MSIPPSISNSIASVKSTSLGSVAGESHFLEETMNPGRVRQYLNAPKEMDKATGMKWLLAMMSKGRDASEFFPDVVKIVVCKSVEVKKMVYMYLTRYADHDATCRELALLSINSFQKDLAASNQLVRAMALRVMSTMRVPEIIQIQLLAVKKCASDSSPYVRKCAANAIPKIFSVDREQEEPLCQIIGKLLKDASCMVLGSAVAAFNEVCPDNWELIHSAYRKLCHLLADVDEWGQITVLGVLSRYIRTHFCDPRGELVKDDMAAAAEAAAEADGAAALANSILGGAAASSEVTLPPREKSKRVKRKVVKKGFYSDEEDEEVEEEIEVPTTASGMGTMQGFGSNTPMNQVMGSGITAAESGSIFSAADVDLDVSLDVDHRLLLRSSLPLLKSRNAGVVLAVCSLHYYCGTSSDSTGVALGKALVRILRNAREIQFVVLKAIQNMSRERPELFVPCLADFFIKSTDPYFCRKLKLEILTSLAVPENSQQILRELQTYVVHADKAFVCDTIAAVGRVADAQPDTADRCVQGLLALVQLSADEEVVAAAVTVARHLVQQNALNEALRGAVLKSLVRQLLADYGFVPASAGEALVPNDGEVDGEFDGEFDGEVEGVGKASLLPEAKASILWLVGEYYQVSGQVLQDPATDVLRIVAAHFIRESQPVKHQALNLAVKLALNRPNDQYVTQLAGHVLELGR